MENGKCNTKNSSYILNKFNKIKNEKAIYVRFIIKNDFPNRAYLYVFEKGRNAS